MNYTVDYNLNDNGISIERTFIPDSLILTLRLNTKKQTVRNVKVDFGGNIFYMIKNGDGFDLELCQNMVKPGLATFNFIIEERLPGEKYLKDTRFKDISIKLSENNISKHSTSNLENIQRHISKLLNNIKES